MVTFSWTSVETGVYGVDLSPDLQAWEEVDDGVSSEGEITSFSVSAGNSAEIYYRVRQLEE